MTTDRFSTKPPINPYLALICGVMAVSTGAIFARVAEAPALVIAAYRVGLAVILLAPVAWWKSRDELLGLTARDIRMALLSGLFLALHFATWISSLDYTSVVNSTVLVNTIPLWVGLMTPMIVGERIRRMTMVSIFLSLLGGVIIGLGDLAIGRGALLGDGLAVIGSICAAVYILLGRSLRRKLSLMPYVVVCYGSAALVLWAIVLLFGLPIGGFSSKTVGALIAMALISQIVGHTSYNWALKWFSAGMISVTLLGEPIGASLLAYIFFNEGITWAKATGGLIILIAIYLAAKGESSGQRLRAARSTGKRSA